MLHANVVEKIKPHILCSITFFSRKLCPLRDVEKYRDTSANEWPSQRIFRLTNVLVDARANIKQQTWTVGPFRELVSGNECYSGRNYLRLPRYHCTVEPGRPRITIRRMRNARCRHLLRICNIYCFSSAKMVARNPLDVTLNVHCLACTVFFVFCLLTSRLPRRVTSTVSFRDFRNQRTHYLNIRLETEHVIIYRMSIISWHCSQNLYRIENLHHSYRALEQDKMEIL